MRLAVKVALAAAGVFAGLWSLALYVVAVDLQADKERRRLKWAQAMGQDFYAILGCPRSADEAAIKSTYKKQALKWHPDRNPDNKDAAAEKFKSISQAYEVLSDPKKKQIYDQYGEEGLQAQAQGGGGPGFQYRRAEDLFAEMFGGGGGFGGMGGGGPGHSHGLHSMFGQMNGGGRANGFPPQREAPVETKLFCSLEELYTGTAKRLRVSWDEYQGGMRQQQSETISVDIRPGWKAGTKMSYAGKGGQSRPGAPPRDLVLVIGEKAHRTFKRDGNDLILNHRLPLVDALCDSVLEVETLDGRQLRVPLDHVLIPGGVKTVVGEGMPISKQPGAKGVLSIKWDISFPLTLSAEQKAALRSILPPV